ncbi:unnamed protein product, partial [Ixodes hexagonus]
LHGHPYIVIKVHEVQHNHANTSRTNTPTRTVSVPPDVSPRKGKRHEPAAGNDVQVDTASLKHQVAGNLLSVLRTIRELDSLANASRRAPAPMPALRPSIEIERVLVDRSMDGRYALLRQRPTKRHEVDELNEDEAEEGDLHRFNLLLRQALNELRPSTPKKRD